MIYPHPYIDYLVQFHAARDYFECHEILEEYWKGDAEEEYATYWIALIQLAVGQYHERRSNTVGALKMYDSSLEKLSQYKEYAVGVDLSDLILQITTRIEQCSRADDLFRDINFVFVDDQLAKACYKEAEARQLQWGKVSNLQDSALIDRHTVRDRSEVIFEREQALKRSGYTKGKKKDK